MNFSLYIVFLVLLLTLTVLVVSVMYKYKSTFPKIDAVISYVDNTDPVWIKSFTEAKRNGDETANALKTWRFRNNNEITYCLKCIEKNCNVFDTVYIVISGKSQIFNLDFLNIEFRKKIKFTTHSEFYVDSTHLPTFNSMSIEANIFNIKGLSEYFVYFNDDCFINKKVTKESFVVPSLNGYKTILRLEEDLVSPRGNTTTKDIGYVASWKNTNKLLDTLFPEKTKSHRPLLQHTPQIQRKSDHIHLKSLFQKEFNDTSKSKFRNINCILVTCGLAPYYSFYKGMSVLNDSRKYLYLHLFINDSDPLPDAETIETIKKFTWINIQDATTHNKKKIKLLLQKIFWFIDHIEDYK